MKEECLICKAPLEYLETDELMECEHHFDARQRQCKIKCVSYRKRNLCTLFLR